MVGTVGEGATRIVAKMELKFTEQQERLLLTCSVERVINTSIDVLDAVATDARARGLSERIRECASSASQDWTDSEAALKYLVVGLWNHHRSEVFSRRQAAQAEERSDG